MNGSIVETRKKSEYSEREGEERQRESTEIIIGEKLSTLGLTTVAD